MRFSGTPEQSRFSWSCDDHPAIALRFRFLLYGNAFQKGSDGYPQDSFAALEWYQKAKDNGEDVDICLKITLLRLTDIYLKGYDGFPPDPTRAVECCRRALLLGDPASQGDARKDVRGFQRFGLRFVFTL